MESVEQQVEKLSGLNADTQLRFDDGDLKSNSNVLSVFSPVLRNAFEAHSAGDVSSSSSTSNSSSTIVIPMEGVTKQQWLAVAPFWYPVNPAPAVNDWAGAELLFRIGSRFELYPVLNKACAYLLANLDKLTPSRPVSNVDTVSFNSTSGFITSASTTSSFSFRVPETPTSGRVNLRARSSSGSSSSSSSSVQAADRVGQTCSHDSCVWKWLLLADELCLSSCIPALIRRAKELDRQGCRNLANTQGLSAPVLQQLVAELA